MKKIILLLALSISQTFAQKKIVDLLVYNATIYTVDKKFTIAQAMVVDKGKFVETGNLQILLSKYSPKEKVDALQKSIFPGFYDPHSHFISLGQTLNQCDLVGTKSFQEILDLLIEFDKKHPEKEWLIGRGWDQNDWATKEYPTNEILSQLFPNKPVALVRIDGHAMLANNKALELSKVSLNTKINGGDFIQKNNKLTGVLIDNAMDFVKRTIPKPDENELRKNILAAQSECLKYGLTTVSDAGIGQEEIELLDKIHKDGSLKIRDYAMVSIGLRNVEYFTKKGIIKTDRLNVRSFKLYADGALGSRGASLLKPYTDAPNTTGLLLMSKNELDKYFSQIIKSNYQANTHCIGDSANRVVLDLYGKYLKGKNNRRWRIEHSQIIDPADMKKFGKYSIIPSIQGTHATSDMYWAKQRLGSERIKTAYPYKELKKQNGMIANGSDFPVEAVNPLFSFHSAVARQDNNNYPQGGFQTENALTRTEALKAMTIWSAYANFEEQERGSIEKGKMADFVILDEDIMTIPLDRIRAVKLNATYIGGEKVY